MNDERKELPAKGGSYIRQNGRLVPAEQAAAKADKPTRPLHAVRNDDQPEKK